MHKYSPVIVDGKLARLSVSQLQRFLDCEYKWYYKYVGGIDEPEQKWHTEGKAGHKKLEEWYKQGTPHELGEHVNELLPGVGLAEDDLKVLDLAGIPFQGAIDLIDGNDIYDYKFQSRIQKFPEPTPQAWGYLEEIRRRLPGSNGVGEQLESREASVQRYRFHYVLISKKGAKPQKQTFEFSPEVIKAQWESYAPTVERMKLVASKQVEPTHNSEQCYKYGPCPYLGICDRGQMSFLDKLNKLKAEQPAVELPDVDASEPSEEAKAKATKEAEDFDPSSYERPPKKAKESIRPPEVRIKTVEVRHSLTLDIKRDGIFSASIGMGFTADCKTEDADAVRKVLSDKVLDAIKLEAERYKK